MTNYQNTLIINNLNLAHNLARKQGKKITCISYDELKSAAYLGLVQAAKQFSPNKNIPFACFARFRIIGAIKDYLRELSWGTRSKKIQMDFSDEYISRKTFTTKKFEELIESLDCQSRYILRLYYLENNKIHEIGTKLSLHPSRIHQLIKEAYEKLRIFVAENCN